MLASHQSTQPRAVASRHRPINLAPQRHTHSVSECDRVVDLLADHAGSQCSHVEKTKNPSLFTPAETPTKTSGVRTGRIAESNRKRTENDRTRPGTPLAALPPRAIFSPNNRLPHDVIRRRVVKAPAGRERWGQRSGGRGGCERQKLRREVTRQRRGRRYGVALVSYVPFLLPWLRPRRGRSRSPELSPPAGARDERSIGV